MVVIRMCLCNMQMLLFTARSGADISVSKVKTSTHKLSGLSAGPEPMLCRRQGGTHYLNVLTRLYLP